MYIAIGPSTIRLSPMFACLLAETIPLCVAYVCTKKSHPAPAYWLYLLWFDASLQKQDIVKHIFFTLRFDRFVFAVRLWAIRQNRVIQPSQERGIESRGNGNYSCSQRIHQPARNNNEKTYFET